MRIVETYSHLNGLEFLLVHKPKLWKELKAVVESIDAKACKTKISKEKTMRGKELFSPVAMNQKFRFFINFTVNFSSMPENWFF